MIRSKPLFTTAKCGKSYDTGDYDGGRRGSQGDGEYTTETYTEDFVVLVNTNHQQIAEKFNNGFQQAERYLHEGKKFRITVIFIIIFY